MRSLILALALGTLAASAAAANPAMTNAPTPMRAAPSRHAHVVQDIPARAQIDISDCGDRWCSASWRDISGYVAVEAITANDAPLERLGPPGPPVVVAPYFGYGWGYGWHRRYYY